LGKAFQPRQKPIHPLPKINQRDEVALRARVKMQDSVLKAIRVIRGEIGIYGDNGVFQYKSSDNASAF
jgi:hypothetical protein